MFGALAGSKVLVIGTHFAAPTAGHVVRDGEAYRLAVQGAVGGPLLRPERETPPEKLQRRLRSERGGLVRRRPPAAGANGAGPCPCRGSR